MKHMPAYEIEKGVCYILLPVNKQSSKCKDDLYYTFYG